MASLSEVSGPRSDCDSEYRDALPTAARYLPGACRFQFPLDNRSARCRIGVLCVVVNVHQTLHVPVSLPVGGGAGNNEQDFLDPGYYRPAELYALRSV